MTQWRSNEYMRNMWLRREISILLFLCLGMNVFGQLNEKLDLPEVRVLKSGPYLGIQRGDYWVGELGAEFQWKRIQLKPPQRMEYTLDLTTISTITFLVTTLDIGSNLADWD